MTRRDERMLRFHEQGCRCVACDQSAWRVWKYVLLAFVAMVLLAGVL